MTRNYADMVKRLDFSKYEKGIMPVIIQDSSTSVVLMLGYMNQEALLETIESKLVTFFSRSKQRLWVKG
ncbi:MAG: phosphoribosyl-AMP cyclohydrolase, partial [Ginsengibacter sp.]